MHPQGICFAAHQKVWEVDPLECPKCGSEMRIISFITEGRVIRKILEHLNLWEGEERIRPPPSKPHSYPIHIHEPFDDGWPGYEEPYTLMH